MLEECHKLRFETRKAAKAGHRRVKNLGIAKKGYVYLCPICDGYHVTHHDKNNRHAITRRIKEK